VTSSTQKTTKQPTVEKAVALIEASDVIGFDLETTGLDPRGSVIRLAQVSDGVTTYVIDLFRRDARPVFEALAAAPTPVAHGAAFEYGFVYHHFGIALDNLRETLLLARIVAAGDMSVDCGLGAVAERELSVTLDKTQQTSDWSAPELSRTQLKYAAMDARILPDLYRVLSEAVSETRQDRVAEIEHGALPATARRRLEGLPVDKAAWDDYAREVAAQRDTLYREMLDAEWMPPRDPVPQTWALQGPDCLTMLRAAGLEVEGTTARDLAPHADNDLVEALLAYRKAKGADREAARVRVLELAPQKAPAPAPPWNFGSPQQVNEIAEKILGAYLKSTSETMLLRFVDWHPFFEHVLRYRKLAKRASTYGPEWFKAAYDETTGRIYPNWHQIGTSTGRFSCSSPNAQNIPNDGPYRSFFRAPTGRTFVDMDYSQIEVRVYAKIVGETTLLKLFDRDNADVYTSTAAQLMNVEESEVTKDERQKAKAIMLGLLYGLSAAGLPAYAFNNYGVVISPDEAEDLIERFFELYPAIEADHEGVLEDLDEYGSVDRRTLAGRRRDGITVRNEAINAPIQGTAADGLKAAMALVYERLKKFDRTAFIVGVFHDELLVECDEGDAAEIEELVKGAMLEAMDALLNADEPRIRLKVSGGITKVWTK
jgi:DNA polymerase I-like protein with 3'-5' exonuclease and polymerase domains